MTVEKAPDGGTETLLDTAMDWLIRLQEQPENEPLARAFQDWLQADPAHARAWQAACHTWGLLGAVLPAVPAAPARNKSASDRGSPGRASPGRIRPHRWGALVAAAAMACLMLAIWPELSLRLSADHLTAVGETRSLTLADGSRVELGAASAVAVHLDDQRREVRLLRGEAFFDVVADRRRPFVVRTDDIAVTVLGTAFNVQAGALSDSVGVASGRVEVHGVADGAARRQTLEPGEHWRLRRDTGETRVVAMAPEDVAAWRGQRLFVEDMPVADVVATLQRYQPGRIVLAGSGLETRQVTGVFDLSDPDRALSGLVEPWQARVRHLSPWLRWVQK